MDATSCGSVEVNESVIMEFLNQLEKTNGETTILNEGC